MKDQTEKYLNDQCETQADFSGDISYWLKDNWDPSKTDEELKEAMMDDMFDIDRVNGYADTARDQADSIIYEVRKLENNN